MLSKSAPRLQSRPGQPLRCDFSRMRGSRPAAVQIRHLVSTLNSKPPGNSRGRVQDFSRAAGRKTHIRSRWIDHMRGAVSELKTRRQAPPFRRDSAMSHSPAASKRSTHSRVRRLRRARAGFTCDSFLFYLTGRVISDNRHGLLRQRAGARAAETLSAVEPQT